MKVGNLVKWRSPLRGGKIGFGIVLELEAVQETDIAKVQWLWGDYPPFMYKVEDLKVVSEA